jgi:hypothetical protein
MWGGHFCPPKAGGKDKFLKNVFYRGLTAVNAGKSARATHKTACFFPSKN